MLSTIQKWEYSIEECQTVEDLKSVAEGIKSDLSDMSYDDLKFLRKAYVVHEAKIRLSSLPHTLKPGQFKTADSLIRRFGECKNVESLRIFSNQLNDGKTHYRMGDEAFDCVFSLCVKLDKLLRS